MDNAESVMVICSFIYSTTLYALIWVKRRQIGFINKGVDIDSKGRPAFIKLLIYTALASIVINYSISRDTMLTLQFTGINLALGALMGSNLLLVRKR